MHAELSEGALTKGPFNALLPIYDMNNALVSYLATEQPAFITAAGYVGPNYRVDHDVSLLVPEIWCRMRRYERDPEWLLENGFLPVISPIGIGVDGQTYNINADTAASRIAAALKAEKVIFMTDVPGVMDNGRLLSTLTTKDTKQLIDTGVIQGGMLPKVDAMLYSLANGVASAHIIGGMDHHAVIAELFTDKGIGTIITH